jgi:hypothetical protein
MEPNSVTKLNLRFQVPDSTEAVSQMRWAMIFVESVHERGDLQMKKNTATAVTTNYRIGVHIYQTPTMIKNRDVKLLSFNAVPNTNDSIYRAVCQNTGGIQIRCKGFMELQNLSDGKKYQIEAKEFPLFPEQKRFVDFVIPASIPRGKYSVMAAIDGGIDLPLEAAQKTIEIKSP